MIIDNCAKTICDKYILSGHWMETIRKNIRIVAHMQASNKDQNKLVDLISSRNDTNPNLTVDEIQSYNTFLNTLSRLVQKPCTEVDHDIMRCLAHECACLISFAS